MTSDYLWRMEAVLDRYAAPADPDHPLVCFDECPLALQRTPRGTIPAAPGRPARIDYEYQRAGSATAFVTLYPAGGWRHVTVLPRRTRREVALLWRELVDVHFPHATTIHIVLDNLNTHTPAALYEVFEPAEARRIAQRLQLHYTPKHGSWLNMVEIELAVLKKQCLGRRLADIAEVRREVAAWAAARNASGATVEWRFTASQARTKLARLYPELAPFDNPA